MARRLSKRELYRLALHFAITQADTEASMADEGTDQALLGASLGARFRELLANDYGEVSQEDRIAGRTGERVPLAELMRPGAPRHFDPTGG